MKSIFTTIKTMFEPNKAKLREEAVARATEVFNIVKEDGLVYIMYRGVKVSPRKYANADHELLETLYDLREMYVEKYIENNGRI